MAVSDAWTDPDLDSVRSVVAHTSDGCEGCLELGTHWDHLMLCLCCGYVGCGDSSAMRHARRHAAATGHPIAESLRPGDHWRWCFVHDARIDSPLAEIWLAPGVRGRGGRVERDRDASRLEASTKKDVVSVDPVPRLGFVGGLESAS